LANTPKPLEKQPPPEDQVALWPGPTRTVALAPSANANRASTTLPPTFRTLQQLPHDTSTSFLAFPATPPRIWADDIWGAARMTADARRTFDTILCTAFS
jgi:hypothetical protein